MEDNMRRDNRKYPRSKCIFPAEIVNSDGKPTIIDRVSVRDFSSGGLKLIISLNLVPNSSLESRVYLPEKGLNTSILGEVVWSRFADDRLEVGLKIKAMEESAREEIIDWLFSKRCGDSSRTV
jgi:hypothetical protein